MPTEKEIVFEVNKLILGQTEDLWLIAAGLISFQALIIAHAVYSLKLDYKENVVAIVISMSTVFLTLSVMFGYFAKGAITSLMIVFATTGVWKFESVAEWMNFLQVFCLTVGLLIFVVAFLFYSRVLARAIVRSSKS